LLLVALGPLTNLALALKLDPTLPKRIARLVVMGGAVTAHGNITAAAEFNIAFDPEAAHIVFSSFARTELVDWEAVMAHGFPHERFEQWLQADSPRARFYDAISRRTRDWAAARRGENWHSADALAMAHALDPAGAIDIAERPMTIELEGRHTRGATIVDWRREEGRPDNVAILLRYDQAAFEARVAAALAAG
jgi:purine nucleosidase